MPNSLPQIKQTRAFGFLGSAAAFQFKVFPFFDTAFYDYGGLVELCAVLSEQIVALLFKHIF